MDLSYARLLPEPGRVASSPLAGYPARARASALRAARSVAASSAQSSWRGVRQAAQEAARGHRTDVDASIGGVTLHPDAIAQNRAAGERAGGIDGDDADSLLLLPVEGRQAIHQRALARTGSPSDAGQIGLSGRRKKASQDLDGSRVAVFDGGNGARDRADVTGANLVGPVVNSDGHKAEA